MRKIRVGIIGFGVSGQVFHAPVIREVNRMEIVKITARKAEQQQKIKKLYPETGIAQDADELFSDPSIDLIVVAVSNDKHYEFAKKALQAGKHVVVEKPFTNTSAQADELIALAKDKGLKLIPYQNRRFVSDYRTLQKVISSGKLGEIVNLEIRYDRFRNHLKPQAWREENLPGSGIFYDLGAHIIDQTLQLFGQPKAVFADLAMQRSGAKAVDNFECQLYYDDLRVSLYGSMLAKIATPRYRVFGLNGSFVKYGDDPQEDMLKAGLFPGDVADWGTENPAIYGKLSVLENGVDIEETIVSEKGSYVDFYQNVADCLQGIAPAIVKPEESRDVIRIIELAEKSHAERSVISLSGELISYSE